MLKVIPGWLRLSSSKNQDNQGAAAGDLDVFFMDTQYLDTDKLIPYEKFTPTTAMYWRVLAKFFAEQDGHGAEEYLGSILPELTPFCLYVRRYILELEKDEDVKWEFMAKELISMTTIYDLGDEVGRKNLCKL